MALQREDIIAAYNETFGASPAESEIRDILANPQYWGTGLNSVVERLTESSRFVNQPVNKDTITRSWKIFFGGTPTESEIQEIINTPQYWGNNVAVLKSRIQESQRWKSNPSIQVAQRVTNESIDPILRQIGLSDDVISSLDQDSKVFYGTIGKQLIDNIDNNIPNPTTFTADTFQELYQKAIDNPAINTKYNNIQDRRIQDILVGVANAQEDYNYLSRQTARQFTNQLEELSSQAEQAGMLYSGIRKRNEQNLAQQQNDIIYSQEREAKNRLQEIGRRAEEALGSTTAKSLNLQLQQPANYGVNINPDVAKRLAQFQNDGVLYSGYNNAISANESQLGQAKQAEITQEYDRLKAERELLTNR